MSRKSQLKDFVDSVHEYYPDNVEDFKDSGDKDDLFADSSEPNPELRSDDIDFMLEYARDEY